MCHLTLELSTRASRVRTIRCTFFQAFIFVLAPLLLVLPRAATASCDKFTIGVNKFDLALQYLGRASGGDGSAEYRKVTQAMARKAIDDASYMGTQYFRIAASGFAPSRTGDAGDLELWLKDPSQYWALIDQMMADLEAASICVVPVLVWNKFQFPALASEPLGAFLRNPQSASWRLMQRYVREYVTRYRHSPNLLFYELTNELNLDVDLDIESSCRNKKKEDQCTLVSNFSTNDMNEFTSRLVSLIRSLDDAHKISSGFALPRPAAQHLRRRPQWSSGRADWTPDSVDELETNLRDIHASVDIISVHLYPASSLRLGLKVGEEFKIADIVQSAAAKIGKPLFIGEFGQPNVLRAPDNSFISNMILEIDKLQVPFSAAWVWEFYQLAPDRPYQSEPSSFSLEPGYTDRLIGAIRRINERQIVSSHSLALRDDNAAPIVVLTKPLACTLASAGSELFAVASRAGGPVEVVYFLVDGKEIGRVTQPPYLLSLPLSGLNSAIAEIEARACSPADKCTSYKAKVIFGQGRENLKQCAPEL